MLLNCVCLDTGSDVFTIELLCLSNVRVPTVQVMSMVYNCYCEAVSSSPGQQTFAFYETLKLITVFTTAAICLYLSRIKPFQNPLILLFDTF